jgi:hypothetical protein
METTTLEILENNKILKVVDDSTKVIVPNETVRILSVGVQGPTGVSSVNDSHYVHTQILAATVWTVVHNMNKYPSVMVVDSGENVVVGEIQYLGLNSLQITFSVPFGGKAYLN